ncbi:MAG: hypothetical protein WCR87_04350 [Saccharofermentanales bacterium]
MANKLTVLAEKGNWYKGNTHCHTILSDGKWSPEKTAALYRDNGYSFLFLSDHRIYGHHSDLSSEEFLVIPATESDISVPDTVFKCFHIVGGYDPGLDRKPLADSDGSMNMPTWDGIGSVQRIVDDLNDHGNLAILAHPVWSRNNVADIQQLKGLTGLEIFNNVCDHEWNCGDSVLVWDLLLSEGHKLWGFASDDTHDPAVHALGGWIVVKAAELTPASIMEALRKGSFYSSTGPEIYEFYVQDGVAYVECSDAKAVHFMTYDNLGKSFRASDGATLSKAEHKLAGYEKYVRVEVVDAFGKRAWSNPIWIE